MSIFRAVANAIRDRRARKPLREIERQTRASSTHLTPAYENRRKREIKAARIAWDSKGVGA